MSDEFKLNKLVIETTAGEYVYRGIEAEAVYTTLINSEDKWVKVYLGEGRFITFVIAHIISIYEVRGGDSE